MSDVSPDSATILPMPLSRAVLLCAGTGSRMGAVGRQTPKCLLEVGGRTLLDRQLEALEACGIAETIVVAGHLADRVRDAAGTRAEVVLNPEYAATNVLASLACAMRERPPAARLLVLAGDVAFDPVILGELLEARAPIRIAVDRSRKDEEAVKVRLRGTRLTEIGKELPLGDAGGEFLGLLAADGSAAMQIAARACAMTDAGDRRAYLFTLLQEILREGHIAIEAIPVGLRRWEEVDTPEDLARARDRFSTPAAPKTKPR